MIKNSKIFTNFDKSYNLVTSKWELSLNQWRRIPEDKPIMHFLMPLSRKE